MIKKELADHVFYNVTPIHQTTDTEDFEAIAIYKGKIIAIGTIPFIFSNYRGFKDYNAQGKYIQQMKEVPFEVGKSATGIVITEQKLFSHDEIIWEIINNNCIARNIDFLDPHWDDH